MSLFWVVFFFLNIDFYQCASSGLFLCCKCAIKGCPIVFCVEACDAGVLCQFLLEKMDVISNTSFWMGEHRIWFWAYFEVLFFFEHRSQYWNPQLSFCPYSHNNGLSPWSNFSCVFFYVNFLFINCITVFFPNGFKKNGRQVEMLLYWMVEK